MAKLYPGDPQSWILLAETFYLMGNLQKAYRIGLTRAARFPDSCRLLYDAACYACLVGQFAQADSLFRAALRARAAKRRSVKPAMPPKGPWLGMGLSDLTGI